MVLNECEEGEYAPLMELRMRRHAAPLGTSLLASTRIGPDTPEPRNSSPVAEKIPKSSLCVLSDGIRGQARERRCEYIVTRW